MERTAEAASRTEERHRFTRLALELAWETADPKLYQLMDHAIVADTSGSNSVISAYALGWMVGLRQPTWDLSDIKNPKVTYSSTASWNFGVGILIRPSSALPLRLLRPSSPDRP